MAEQIVKISAVIDNILGKVIYIALFLMVFAVFGQVIFRYMLSAPPVWTEELARYVFIWVSFLAAAYAYRKGAHIVIDVLISKLSGKLKEIHYNLINIVIVVFLFIVFIYSIKSFEIVGTTLSPALAINMKYIHLSLTVSSLLMLFYTVVILIERYHPKYRKENDGREMN